MWQGPVFLGLTEIITYVVCEYFKRENGMGNRRGGKAQPWEEQKIERLLTFLPHTLVPLLSLRLHSVPSCV